MKMDPALSWNVRLLQARYEALSARINEWGLMAQVQGEPPRLPSTWSPQTSDIRLRVDRLTAFVEHGSSQLQIEQEETVLKSLGELIRYEVLRDFAGTQRGQRYAEGYKLDIELIKKHTEANRTRRMYDQEDLFDEEEIDPALSPEQRLALFRWRALVQDIQQTQDARNRSYRAAGFQEDGITLW